MEKRNTFGNLSEIAFTVEYAKINWLELCPRSSIIPLINEYSRIRTQTMYRSLRTAGISLVLQVFSHIAVLDKVKF